MSQRPSILQAFEKLIVLFPCSLSSPHESERDLAGFGQRRPVHISVSFIRITGVELVYDSINFNALVFVLSISCPINHSIN